MSGPIKTYNPKKVIVTWLGYTFTGFVKGTFVEITPNSDGFTLEVGSDGEGARVVSADESFTIKLSLMQTSAGNDHCSAQYVADKQTNTNTGPFMVKDLNGRSLFSAPNTWIKKLPVGGFSNEISSRDWEFETDAAEFTVGGN